MSVVLTRIGRTPIMIVIGERAVDPLISYFPDHTTEQLKVQELTPAQSAALVRMALLAFEEIDERLPRVPR